MPSFTLNLVILNQITSNRNSNNIINSQNINIDGSAQKIFSSRKGCIGMSSSTGKGLFFALVLFLLTLGTFIIALLHGMDRINNLKNNLQIKQNLIVEIEDRNNRTVKQSNNFVLEQQRMIEQLNKILVESNAEHNQTVKRLSNLILEKECWKWAIEQDRNRNEEWKK